MDAYRHITPDAQTTALALSPETSARTHTEATEMLPSDLRAALDAQRERGEETVNTPPNAAGQREEIPVIPTRKGEPDDSNAEKRKIKNLKARADLNRIVRARTPLRKLGVPLFATDSQIIEAHQKAIRDYHSARIDQYRVEDVISPELARDADDAMQDVRGLAHRANVNGSATGEWQVDNQQKSEINKLREQRVTELATTLEAIEAQDAYQLAQTEANSLNGKTFSVTETKNADTGEVIQKKSRGPDGIETALHRSRQQKEKIIHPATLLRDGLITKQQYDEWRKTGKSSLPMLQRAGDAVYRLSVAHSIARDFVRQETGIAFQQNPRDATSDAVWDYVKAERKKQVEQQQPKASIPPPDNPTYTPSSFRREPTSSPVDDPRRGQNMMDAARRMKRSAEERTPPPKATPENPDRENEQTERQEKEGLIRRRITEQLHTRHDLRDKLMREEKERRKRNAYNLIALAYNDLYSIQTRIQIPIDSDWVQRNRRKYPPDRMTEILTPFYDDPSNRVRSGESYLLQNLQLETNASRVSQSIQELATLRDQRSTEGKGVFFHPVNGKWYSADETDPRLCDEAGQTVTQIAPNGKDVDVLTPDGFKTYRLRENNKKAGEQFDAQFEQRDGQQYIKDIRISDTLSLRHIQTQMSDNNPTQVAYYVLEGAEDGKKYTVRLSRNLGFHDMKIT